MSKLLRCGPNHQTLVDDDFEIPEGHGLSYNNRGYCSIYRQGMRANGKHGTVMSLLHRIIMRLPSGDINKVDHINRDKLDNRKCNLRVCTQHQNLMNNISKCAYFDARRNKWRALITHNGSSVWLGYFPCEQMAIDASNDFKLKTRGDFAHTWPTESQQQLA